MANQLKISGSFTLDAGAVRVLCESGRSLLPVGVVSVDGKFDRGSLVSLCDSSGIEIGRGLSNYSSQDAQRIKGLASDNVRSMLGELADTELVHRDHLVLF
jgi:glutamate 5-kinase